MAVTQSEHNEIGSDQSTEVSTPGWSSGQAEPYQGPPAAQDYQSAGNASNADPSGYPPAAQYSPDYPQQGYQQQGYQQQGYQPNPPYQQPYGYPPYGYQLQRGPGRPGGMTASAVLMFIQAAVVLISTFYVLFGASVAGGLDNNNALQTEWTVIGILQLVSVGLLIFGGIQLLGGSGRTIAIVANGIQLALVLYWMIRIGSLADFDVDGQPFFFVIPLMYAVLPAVALPLTANKGAARFLEAKKLESSATR